MISTCDHNLKRLGTTVECENYSLKLKTNILKRLDIDEIKKGEKRQREDDHTNDYGMTGIVSIGETNEECVRRP